MALPLTAGDMVYDFILPGMDGAQYDSRAARDKGLLMFVFWKKGCGTCRYSMPFLQRFHDHYAGKGFQIWGISQDNREDTIAFINELSLTFQQTLDEDLELTESYRLITVPGVYLVGASDQILRHAEAFDSNEFNAMAALIAEVTGQTFLPIVQPEDNAPAIKPG